MDLIEFLEEKAPTFVENDLAWITPQVVDYQSSTIRWLAQKYFKSQSDVIFFAMKELAIPVIGDALHLFLFRSELWKNNRKLNSYLIGTLNNLFDNYSKDKIYTQNVLFLPKSQVSQLPYLGGNNYFETIKNIIKTQTNSVERFSNQSSIVKRKLMYGAFEEMLNEEPEQMIQYLVHGVLPNFSVHAKIFQKFAIALENYLPFSYEMSGKVVSITSLLDEDLLVFLGISKFDAVVSVNGNIPNNTSEIFIGGKNCKNYGKCFIGHLIKVEDQNGNSLMDKVVEYSFTTIVTSLPAGMKVSVEHYRIASHWDIDGLYQLRAVRQKIVDKIKVFKKKNGF